MEAVAASLVFRGPLVSFRAQECSTSSQSLTSRFVSLPFQKRVRLEAFSSPRNRGHGCLKIVAMAGQGVKGVESDINEDVYDVWRTAGDHLQGPGELDTFDYGHADGAHDWHKGDDGEFLDEIQKSLKAAGGPSTPLQKGLAWLFLPAFISSLFYGVQPEYYMGATAVFLFAYIGQEMAKPSRSCNFEGPFPEDAWGQPSKAIPLPDTSRPVTDQ